MSLFDEESLRRRYSLLSDVELPSIVAEPPGNYQPGVQAVAAAELVSRGITQPEAVQILSQAQTVAVEQSQLSRLPAVGGLPGELLRLVGGVLLFLGAATLINGILIPMTGYGLTSRGGDRAIPFDFSVGVSLLALGWAMRMLGRRRDEA